MVSKGAASSIKSFVGPGFVSGNILRQFTLQFFYGINMSQSTRRKRLVIIAIYIYTRESSRWKSGIAGLTQRQQEQIQQHRSLHRGRLSAHPIPTHFLNRYFSPPEGLTVVSPSAESTQLESRN